MLSPKEVAIARAVRSSREHQWGDTVNAVDDVAIRVGVALRDCDARFDYDAFLDACGVTDPKRRSVVVG